MPRSGSIEHARRQHFSSPLERAADAYLVKRGKGKTLIAGYPWFGDWGRDTFIALRGLCIATGHLEEARDILLQWAGTVSEGMLPNRFPDQGEQPEFNSVDASLWYIIAVNDYLLAADETADADRRLSYQRSCARQSKRFLLVITKEHASASVPIAMACSRRANTVSSSLGWTRASMAARSRRASGNQWKFRLFG